MSRKQMLMSYFETTDKRYPEKKNKGEAVNQAD